MMFFLGPSFGGDANSTDGTRPARHGRLSHSMLLAVALLLLFFLQVVTAATQTSLTSDEAPQLTSGYSYLVSGDPHLVVFDAHPPLAKLINSAPLLLVPDLGSPAGVPAWRSDDPISLLWVTEQFFYPYRPLDRLVIAGRVPVALWGVLLGALAYRWGSDLFGPLAGLAALFLVSFDPNLLAHAGLATNDLPVTAASFAALFTFWRFLRRPSLKSILLAGVVLGVAQGTKLNALLLLPVQGLLAFAVAVLPQRPHMSRKTPGGEPTPLRYGALAQSPPRHVSRFTYYVLRITYYVSRLALIWFIAALVLWASYGFELRPLPGWPFPVPAGTHLLLWERVTRAAGGGHPAFLMGELSHEGWWHYFPVAFAIKTPLPSLIALSLSVVAFAAGWRRKNWVDELALALFAVLYAGFTVFSRLNIGYRHLLPVLPFLFVFASRLFDLQRWRHWRGRVRAWGTVGGASLLSLWLVTGTVAIWPFHLAFFNESVGGPDRGYHYLVDSNTDWGQALKALRRYMDENGIERVRLSTFIEYSDAIRWYGVPFDPLPPLHAAPGLLPARFDPEPGVYVISSTTLQGIFTADPEMYDWFRKREPVALIGHAMLLFRKSEADRGEWVAQCLDPVPPLPPHLIVEGFGRPDLRVASFDCATSWLIPAGGASPGWYVLLRVRANGDDRFVQAHLGQTHLGFEQTRRGEAPPFAIFEASSLSVAPAHPAVPGLEAGVLSFLGHTLLDPKPEQPLEVWTFWRVQALPDRPLSLMLHLVGSDGGPVVVGDGLGVPVENWQVGDVIVQRHQLLLPPEAPGGEYALYTGVYWLDSLERWPVRAQGRVIGDALELPPVMVDR